MDYYVPTGVTVIALVRGGNYLDDSARGEITPEPKNLISKLKNG